MAELVVPLELIDVTPVEGLCRECFLPSMLRVTLALRNDRDTVASSIASQVVCGECGLPEEE